MGELGAALVQLAVILGTIFRELLVLVVRNALVVVWLAWWLGAVNWKRLWPVLGLGAWAVVVLLWFMTALVWSRLDLSAYALPFVTVPNFWWQLVAVGLLICSAFLCGWLQGVFGWTPPAVALEPQPAHAPAQEVGHGRGPLSVQGPDPGHEIPE